VRDGVRERLSDVLDGAVAVPDVLALAVDDDDLSCVDELACHVAQHARRFGNCSPSARHTAPRIWAASGRVNVCASATPLTAPRAAGAGAGAGADIASSPAVSIAHASETGCRSAASSAWPIVHAAFVRSVDSHTSLLAFATLKRPAAISNRPTRSAIARAT
jgi:hypothetical protein